jgi:hypothetical protein
MKNHFFAAATILGILASTIATSCFAQTTPCMLKASELTAALGVPFKEGVAGKELAAGDLTMQSCNYDSKNYTVRLGLTHYKRGKPTPPAANKALAGKMQIIPNDPDGAAHQVGQGDLTSPTLLYARGAYDVELRVMGIYYTDSKKKADEMKTLNDKLSKLRRVP